MPTWCVVGASRGIGFEFVRQLLERGDQVIAAVRNAYTASELWQLAATRTVPGACQLCECDVTSERSINTFAARVLSLRTPRIDYLVLSVGLLKYPNRATEISFADFEDHLRTNTIGPIITAQRLLATQIPIQTIVFLSSDSGSATNFRDLEDGFGAYAASKAALNQMLRHMAAELKRMDVPTTVLAMHPGQVATGMTGSDVEREIEGILTPEESVEKMLAVIPQKTIEDTGTFWTWEGEVYPW